MSTTLPDVGGLLLFASGHNPFKAGVGFLLSDLIELITHSQYSHSAILMPSIDGVPYLYESTISGGISGPQRSLLSTDLASYTKEGGHTWLLPFLPQLAPDWTALEAMALKMIAQRQAGQLPYNVKRLFSDAESRSWVFDVVALPADGVIEYLAAHSKGVVCSEMAGLLIQAGGAAAKLTAAGIPWLPKVSPAGQPIGCSPQDLANVPMWATPVQLA